MLPPHAGQVLEALRAAVLGLSFDMEVVLAPVTSHQVSAVLVEHRHLAGTCTASSTHPEAC